MRGLEGNELAVLINHCVIHILVEVNPPFHGIISFSDMKGGEGLVDLATRSSRHGRGD